MWFYLWHEDNVKEADKRIEVHKPNPKIAENSILPQPSLCIPTVWLLPRFIEHLSPHRVLQLGSALLKDEKATENG